jgi:hypothetical protein
MDPKRKVYPLIQTQGSGQIDLDGLNPEDKLRISQIGFSRWLAEASTAQELRIARRSN